MDKLVVLLVCILNVQNANCQRGGRTGSDVMNRGGMGSAARGADSATAFASAADMFNPMGPGRPFVPGMTANQVADLMGGRMGPVPMDIALEAQQMRMLGHTPDQIADILGDRLQLRFSNPFGALASAAMSAAATGQSGGMFDGGNGNAAGGAGDQFGGMGGGARGQSGSDIFNVLERGSNANTFGGQSRPGQGLASDFGTAGMGSAASLLNPMGPGRPFVPGMTANQVADLMGGRPGPVPMDIAQEAQQMRMLGHTPDQIADILGDRLQLRFSNPFRAMAGAAFSQAMGTGTNYAGQNLMG